MTFFNVVQQSDNCDRLTLEELSFLLPTFLDEDVFINLSKSRTCTTDSLLCALKKLPAQSPPRTAGLRIGGVLGKEADGRPSGPHTRDCPSHGHWQLERVVGPRAPCHQTCPVLPHPPCKHGDVCSYLLSLEQADWNSPLLPLVYRILFIKFQKKVDEQGRIIILNLVHEWQSS